MAFCLVHVDALVALMLVTVEELQEKKNCTGNVLFFALIL